MVDRGILDKGQHIPSSCIDSRVPTREGARALPKEFVPGGWDIICHSSKEAHEHGKFVIVCSRQAHSIPSHPSITSTVGNRRFNICIGNHVSAYNKAKSRPEKSALISHIVVSIRESSTTGAGFVRFDMETRRWYEVGDKAARDKVGQSLRKYNSRKRSKETPSPLPIRTKAVADKCIPARLELSSRIDDPGASTRDWMQMKASKCAPPTRSYLLGSAPSGETETLSALNDMHPRTIVDLSTRIAAPEASTRDWIQMKPIECAPPIRSQALDSARSGETETLSALNDMHSRTQVDQRRTSSDSYDGEKLSHNSLSYWHEAYTVPFDNVPQTNLVEGSDDGCPSDNSLHLRFEANASQNDSRLQNSRIVCNEESNNHGCIDSPVSDSSLIDWFEADANND